MRELLVKPNYHYMKHLITITLIIIAYVTVQAQDGEACRFPQDPTLENPQDYKGFDVVTILDSISVNVQPTGSGTFVIYKAFKVLTEKGAVNNRVVVYDYDPLTAFAEFKNVTIFRANGDVLSLDVSKAYDYVAPARAIFWGARQIMIEIGSLRPGDIVEYEISKKGFTYALLSSEEMDQGLNYTLPVITDINHGNGYSTSDCTGLCQGLTYSLLEGEDDDSRFVPPMRGQFYDIVPFWVTEPTVRKVYTVSVPMEKELQFQFYNGECSSSMRYEDNMKSYTFIMSDARPFMREPNMVDLFDAAPKLFMSSTPKWEDKSLWFNKVNEDYGSFASLPEAQKKVNELIKGKTSDMEKIAVLTHWVADNIRYSGISMGKGEGYTLHNTKMNFTDRCGVCKDIAGTLISFLRMAGFEAFPAMTMAGSRVESIPADHFNHCVAVVKLSNGTYMPLDPTWVPFCRELWSSAEQQQNYLPGIPEGSDILLTPVSPPENHYIKITANNRIDTNGTLSGQFTITGEGQSDSNIRRIFTQGWQTDWYNTMEQQLLAVSPKAKLISVDYGKNPKDYQAAPIKITFRYEIPDYAIPGKQEMLIKPLVMNNLYASIQSHLRINTNIEKLEYGFKDACSRLVELNETIQLPKGYTLVTASKEDSKKSDAADFEGFIRQEGNNIKLYQKLALKKRVYEASDWTGFRDAVNAHKSFGEYFVVQF